jgi:PKD repeat protein
MTAYWQTINPVKALSLLILSLCLLNILASCTGNDKRPTVNIITETPRLLQGYPILFSAQLNRGSQPADYDFTWSFGDQNSGTGQDIEHTYLEPGEYLVSVTITGNSGEEASDAYSIVVRPSLELVEWFNLDVDSPSGLSLGAEPDVFYTISDKPNGRVTKIDTRGNVLDRLNYLGADLEGVCFDSRDSTFWVVEEGLAQLIHLDPLGDPLSIQTIPGVSTGGGLEAVTLNEASSQIIMLKEKDFGALIIFDQITLAQNLQQMAFAPDYSGLFYHASTGDLWVLSDEASTIYRIDGEGAVRDSYSFDMTQPEGLVYHDGDSSFYVVDDTEDRLYRYRFWEMHE